MLAVKITFFLTLLIPFFLQGKESPHVLLNSQNELEIRFAPDKVAVVSAYENKNKIINIEMKKTDATCEERVAKTQCVMKTWYSYHVFQPVWKAHPDSSRIGKALKNKKGGNKTPVFVLDWSLRFLDGNLRDFLFSEKINSAEPTRMTCDDYNWLPAASRIEYMSFESFATSKETDQNQNKTVNSFDDLAFTKKNGAVELTGMKTFGRARISSEIKMASPVTAEIIGVKVQSKKGECKYTFTRSTSRNIVQQHAAEAVTDFKPIRFGSLKEAVRQLTQQGREELAAYNRNFAMIYNKAPESVQILDAFGLLTLKFESGPDGDYNLKTAEGDIE